MSNIKINNPAIKITPKITGLTQQEITGIITQSQKKRFPAPAPKPIVLFERRKAYNGVLSKIDPSKIIRVIPNPTVTLTPAAPRSQLLFWRIGLALALLLQLNITCLLSQS